MSGSGTANFFARNKTAVLLATVAGASAVGAYFYYQQQQATSDSATKDELAKKKKNKKKKKSKSASDSNEEKANGETKGRPYPIDTNGLPAIADESVKSLSEKETEAWAAALKEDGNAKFKAKSYKEAIAFYSAALQLKIDPVFYSNRSACYAALNDHENVIKDTTEAIKIKPDYTKCVLRRATSYEILEKYTDAMFDLTALTIYGGFSNKSVEQVLERVLKKHSVKIVEGQLKNRVLELPSASTIGSFFGAFVEETNPEGVSEESEGADKFLYDGVKNLNANTPEGYDSADTAFNQAVEAYKVDELTADSANAAKASIALEYAASMKFLKNDPNGASALIEKSVGLKPRARTYIFRALIHADKASFAEAIADFNVAEKMEPNFPDIYYHLGQLHYLTGNLKLAEENFTKAKDLNANNVYAYVQLACITYKNGDFDTSEKKFNEAKLKFPASPEIPNYYGEILADKGDIAGACRLFDVSARLQEVIPNYSVGALPLINKATLISRESVERLDEAEKLLLKASALDPKSELARISLAQIKLQKEQVDEAIELFEESSALARTIEEKVQATSFAEATKMQKRIKLDPILTKKIEEVIQSGAALA